jgi:hypothetical protein
MVQAFATSAVPTVGPATRGAGDSAISTAAQDADSAKSYDAAGNTLSYGANTYTFNQRGRMNAVMVGTNETDYIYNALGQLIRKSGAAFGGYLSKGRVNYMCRANPSVKCSANVWCVGGVGNVGPIGLQAPSGGGVSISPGMSGGAGLGAIKCYTYQMTCTSGCGH